MATFTAAPYETAFTRAEAFLAKGRDKTNRPLQNNTRMIRVSDDEIAIVLHQTAVVTYRRSGTFVIYGGGWNTVTTKDRIRSYSPAHPCSDGHGGWIVGHTGEITPPRVQKCRSCSGVGRWMADDECWGPSTWGPGACQGYTVQWDDTAPIGSAEWHASRREVLCEHGKRDRHATEPCHHGEWARHIYGRSERVCHRCKGEGRTDYGSKPVPIVLDSSVPYLVDADGTFLDVANAPGYVGNGYAPPKPAPAPSPHDVGGSLVGDLARVLPNVRANVRHPVSGEEAALDTVIVSLNDRYRWTRERVADWLESLDLDLRFTS